MKIITKINKKDKSSDEIKTNIISIFKFLNIFVLEKELDLIFNKQTYKRPIITAFDKLNDINIFISKIELTEDDSFIYIHFNSFIYISIHYITKHYLMMIKLLVLKIYYLLLNKFIIIFH